MNTAKKSVKKQMQGHFVKRCLFCGGIMEPTKYIVGGPGHPDAIPRITDREQFRLHCCRTCGIAFHVKEQA